MSRSFVRSAGALTLTALLSASCAGADDHARRGDAFAAAGKVAEAILEYRNAIQQEPKRADFHLKLAALYDQSGDIALALDESVKAADLNPTNVTAQLRAGSMLLVAGRFEDAKTRATTALSLDPKNAEAQILLGNALAGVKDLDGALAEYQEAIALNPSEDAAYTNIAAIRLVLGRREDAEASFRKAIAVAPQSPRAHMALANFLWASGRGPEAEEEFKGVLAFDPENVSANQALGVYYLTSNRPAASEPYFKAVAASAKTPQSLLMLADYYGYMHRYADARRILDTVNGKDAVTAATKTRLAALDATARLTSARLLGLDGHRVEAVAQARVVADDESNIPAATDANLLIGSLEAEQGHRAAAQSAFESVLRLRPQTVEAALNLATLQFSAGNYSEAQNRAKQALSIHPADRQARLMLVRVAIAQKDLTGARDGLVSLSRDFPTWAAVWDLRANLELRSGQVDAARQSFTKAASFEPTDLEALAGLIAIDLGTHHAADAIARVEAGLKAEKPSGAFFVLAARAYTAAGQTANAEDVLKRAIAANPAGLEAYSFLGQLYIDQHRVDEALARFQEIVRLDPRSVSALTMLGMLLEAQSKTSEAEAQYQAALKIDSHAAIAANNLAWIYADGNRNIDQAVLLAQTAADQLPDEPHIADTLGWAYYRKQMSAAAVHSLELSVAKDASDPATHYHLGMAYVLAGDRLRAKQELQRALASNAQFAGQDEAKAALAKLGVR